jgi:hypothetical protein
MKQARAQPLFHRIQMLGRHGWRQAELAGGRGEASGVSGTRKHLHSCNTIKHRNFPLPVKTESLSPEIIAHPVKL